MTTRKKLCAIKGISEAKVDKIKVLFCLFISLEQSSNSTTLKQKC